MSSIEAISVSPLFFLKNMQCAQNEEERHKHDHNQTAVPEEISDEVNDVEEEAEDNEQDH